MRQYCSAHGLGLVAEFVHPHIQFDSIVASDITFEKRSIACMRIYAPVNDVPGLDEEVNLSGPITLVVNYSSHLQHLERVRHVSVEVSNGDNLPSKLSLGRVSVCWGMMFVLRGAVMVYEVGRLQRLLVRVVGVTIVIGVLRVFVVRVHGKRPRQRQTGDKVDDRNEGPADPENAEDRDENGEDGEKARHPELCAPHALVAAGSPFSQFCRGRGTKHSGGARPRDTKAAQIGFTAR